MKAISQICNQIIRLVFLLTMIAVIAGCSTVGEVLENQYVIAQHVEQKCKEINEQFIVPSGETVKAELVGRLRTNLTSVFCSANKNNWEGICSEPNVGSLKVRFTSSIKDLVDHVSYVRADLKQSVFEIKKSILKIDESLDSIDKSIDEAHIKWRQATLLDCTNKLTCAQNLILNFRKPIGELKSRYRDIEKELANISVIALRIESVINDGYPDLASNLALSVSAGRQVVQAAYEAVDLFVNSDARSIAEKYLTIKVEYAAANRTLQFIENGLRPADRLLDKGDDKLFFLPSLVVTWQTEGIQEKMDNLFAKLVQPAIPEKDGKPAQVEGPLHNPHFLLAFQKAACMRLSDNNRLSSSQLMPFVNRMFLSDKLGKPENSKKTVKSNFSKFSNLYAKSTIGSSSITEAELYQNCYMTNITMVAARKVNQFKGSFSDAVNAGALACGNMASPFIARQKDVDSLKNQVSIIDQKLADIHSMKSSIGQSSVVLTKYLEEEKSIQSYKKIFMEKINEVQDLPRPYGQDNPAGWSAARRQVSSF